MDEVRITRLDGSDEQQLADARKFCGLRPDQDFSEIEIDDEDPEDDEE